EIVAVCAPSLAKDPSLRTPGGLGRHMLLRTAAPAARTGARRARPGSQWLAWFAAAGVPIDGAIRKGLEGAVFSAREIAIETAGAGRGVALVPEILVERDIASGRLVRLFPIGIADANAHWVLWRADRARESRMRTFI